jgi:hypothetical protein
MRAAVAGISSALEDRVGRMVITKVLLEDKAKADREAEPIMGLQISMVAEATLAILVGTTQVVVVGASLEHTAVAISTATTMTSMEAAPLVGPSPALLIS